MGKTDNHYNTGLRQYVPMEERKGKVWELELSEGIDGWGRIELEKENKVMENEKIGVNTTLEQWMKFQMKRLGWNKDKVCEKTGLQISQVHTALEGDRFMLGGNDIDIMNAFVQPGRYGVFPTKEELKKAEGYIEKNIKIDDYADIEWNSTDELDTVVALGLRFLSGAVMPEEEPSKVPLKPLTAAEVMAAPSEPDSDTMFLSTWIQRQLEKLGWDKVKLAEKAGYRIARVDKLVAENMLILDSDAQGILEALIGWAPAEELFDADKEEESVFTDTLAQWFQERRVLLDMYRSEFAEAIGVTVLVADCVETDDEPQLTSNHVRALNGLLRYYEQRNVSFTEPTKEELHKAEKYLDENITSTGTWDSSPELDRTVAIGRRSPDKIDVCMVKAWRILENVKGVEKGSQIHKDLAASMEENLEDEFKNV